MFAECQRHLIQSDLSLSCNEQLFAPIFHGARDGCEAAVILAARPDGSPRWPNTTKHKAHGLGPLGK
jgi:hypothetical protein